MTIDCYFLNWNESEQICLTIDHYKSFCRNVIVYDNHSTDDSAKIAQEMGCEVRTFGMPGVLDDFAYLEVKNNCWKNSDADYVIVCDCDEILFHKDLEAVLDMERQRGTTLFRTQGYNMFSEAFPATSYFEVKTGVQDGTYSKSLIFDPKALREIAYLPGCHVARPEGMVEVSLTTLPVLHYRCIGGFIRMYERHWLYNSRLSENNKRWQMGNYGWVEDKLLIKIKCAEFDDFLQKSATLEQVFGSLSLGIPPGRTGG